MRVKIVVKVHVKIHVMTLVEIRLLVMAVVPIVQEAVPQHVLGIVHLRVM